MNITNYNSTMTVAYKKKKMFRSKTSCQSTCPSHLCNFRCQIVFNKRLSSSSSSFSITDAFVALSYRFLNPSPDPNFKGFQLFPVCFSQSPSLSRIMRCSTLQTNHLIILFRKSTFKLFDSDYLILFSCSSISCRVA